MNKVFKVIWSDARSAYVVVSEIAKNHGSKSCSTKKLLTMLLATGVMTCASMAPVMAAPTVADDATVTVGKKAEVNVGENAKVDVDKKIAIGINASAKGAEGVAIGKNSEASASGYATAIGGDARATGSKSTVVGNYSNATELGAISIGYGNRSSGANAITIGHDAIAAGMNSFAFGSEAKANKEASIAFGSKSFSDALGAIAIGSFAQALGTNSIAIGQQAIASKEYSVVIGAHTDKTGTGSNVTAVGQQTEVLGNKSTAVGMAAKANFEHATAIGSYANALAEYSVALGAGSTASRKAGVQGYDPLTRDNSADRSWVWKSTKGAVSVGDVGVTRQIINVAAGSEDSDAVNVAQLKKVAVEAGKHTTLVDGKNTTVKEIGNGANGKQYQVNVKLDDYAKTEDVAVVYDKNKTSLRSTNATGVAENAIALGKGAYAVKNSIAIGNGAYTQDGSWTPGQSVALGNGAVTGAKSTSIGSNAIGGREGTITIGANANNGSLYATIIGTDSKVNYMTRNSGAAATIVGAKSEIKNDNKSYSGVANGIFGSANTIENSNGVTIQGSGNTVTNAYKNMSGWDFNLGGVYVKKDAGAVGVIGGMNTVSDQIYTNVIGFGNTVAGDADNISHDVFVAGSRNNLSKVSDSIVMGNDNEISDKSNVISLGHENNITANNAVAIGNGASVSAEGGVALGIGSVADRAAGELGYGAAKGETGIAWKATHGAVSVGGNGATRQITNVAAGTADTDAVNVAQLKTAKTEVQAGANITSVEKTTGANGQDVYTINANGTTVSGDSNVAVTAGKKDANNVTNYSVKLNKDLKGIESVSNGSASLKLSSNPIFGATAKLTNGKASVELLDSTTIINGKVQVRQDGSIGGVTAGRVDNDAVNLGQLKDVKAEALKHTTLSDGKNTTVAPTVKDGQTDYKVNVAGDLTDITSVANGDAKLTLGGIATELTNGQGASVKLFRDTTTINNAVTVYKDGRIAGVADGVNANDAVNVSQLQKAAAESATTVSDGVNTTVTAAKAEDGHTDYKVNLNKDLVGIESISNGDAKLTLGGFATELANGQGASVKLFRDTTTINNAVTVYKDGRIAGVADGVNANDAVNVSQLQKAAAESATTVSDGVNTTVTAAKAEDGHTDYKVNLNKDLVGIESISNGDAKLTLGGFATELANGQGASVKLFRDTTTINNAVTVYKDGRIAGVADGVNANDAVNVSQLQKAAAESATTVSDGVNTTVTAAKAEDGHTDYKVNLNKDLVGIESISNGDAKLTLGGFATELANGQGASVKLFRDTTTINNAVTVYKDGRIAGVAAGINDNDAVNVGQLKEFVAANDTHIKSGDYAVGEVTDSNGNKSQGVSMDIVNKAGDVTGTVTITDVAKASDVGDVNNIASDIKNKEGKTTVVDAVNNLNNKVGDLQYSKVEKGEIADGDSTTTAIGKLDQKLTDVAATAAKHTKVVNGSNITVEETAQDGQKTYKVGLNKDILLGDITGKNVSISGTNGTIETTGYIATKDRVYADKGAKLADVDITGDTISNDKSSVKLDKEGTVTINNKVTIDGNGKVSGVADGEISATSTDAVNGGQLYKTNQAIANNATNISSLSHSISNLDNRVNKVGAGAAALAALHPLDFDPDAKWDFAAGYGNYRGTNAAAVGAYYRPNEDTMFSVGGTFGNGENMVNAGVSFKLGSGSSHVSTSRVAMAKEIKELRGELEAMKSAMLDANAGKKIDTSKLQLFPDVPQNHWAYEYVAQLAGNGMIEGYPDGNFAGDRPMTRYEFAAILYRAMMKGAVLSDKILSEFSHELEYFTVDTVAKDKAGNPTIQRVRTVKANTNK